MSKLCELSKRGAQDITEKVHLDRTQGECVPLVIHTNLTAGSFLKAFFLCPTLSHRNYIHMMLNCYPNDAVLTNVTTAWIMFTGNFSGASEALQLYRAEL